MTAGPAPRVAVWAIQDRRSSAVPRPWVVRWRVGDRGFSRAHTHKAQAEELHARLRIAASDGLRFSEMDGLPEAWTKDNPTVAVYACRWLERQWPTWSPRSRIAAVDALVRACEAAVSAKAPRLNSDQAAKVRHVLAKHLLLPGGDEPCAEDKTALDYIGRYSLHLQDLDDSAVVSLHHELGVSDAGTPLAAVTAKRRRVTTKAMLYGAVAEGLIAEVKWPKTAKRQKTKQVESYNPDLLIDQATFQSLLDQIEAPRPAGSPRDASGWTREATGRYRAYLSVIFYSGLRPSEAAALDTADVTLPKSGWGSIKVQRTSRREDPEEYRDAQDADTGPGKTGSRTVPIPPVLVAELRSHINTYVPGKSGPLFDAISAGSRSRLWARLKAAALPKRSRLQETTVYDLRHSCATLMLRAGVPIPVAARRLGHSPDVLMKVYAGVLEGDETSANELLDGVWGKS